VRRPGDTTTVDWSGVGTRRSTDAVHLLGRGCDLSRRFGRAVLGAVACACARGPRAGAFFFFERRGPRVRGNFLGVVPEGRACP
jgi:hypothetical protein